MKLKLDLHTHCFEATGYVPPTVEIVGHIVERVKIAGLDGIGVTEHWDKDYGFKVKDIVEEFYDNEILIIPGHEIDVSQDIFEQAVELFLPNDTIFRFWVHPTYPGYLPMMGNLHGIEVENALHDGQMNTKLLREVAERYDLLMLKNSDAHSLHSIGSHYNEISLEELFARARPKGLR